jgi:hypothetical protein
MVHPGVWRPIKHCRAKRKSLLSAGGRAGNRSLAAWVRCWFFPAPALPKTKAG